MPHNLKPQGTDTPPGQGLLLGLTGGIAMGKSTVAAMFEELGARSIDFDRLSREVMEPDRPAWRDIVEYFGSGVLNPDRSLNRAALGEIVFTAPDQRKVLESFTHPRISQAFARHLDEIRRENPKAAVLAVVPLLLETGMQGAFRKIIVIDVHEDEQLRRLTARDHLSREAALARIRSQMPAARKRELADYVIDNSGTLDETRAQVEAVWRELTEDAGS